MYRWIVIRLIEKKRSSKLILIFIPQSYSTILNKNTIHKNIKHIKTSKVINRLEMLHFTYSISAKVIFQCFTFCLAKMTEQNVRHIKHVFLSHIILFSIIMLIYIAMLQAYDNMGNLSSIFIIYADCQTRQSN